MAKLHTLTALFALLVLTPPQQPPVNPSGPPPPSEGQHSSKTQTKARASAANTTTIADLERHVGELNQRIQNLEAGESDLHMRLTQFEAQAAIRDSNKPSRPDLSQVKLDLVSFHYDCQLDFQKGVAMALTEGKPSLTYQGAAAMDCTERLQKIVQEIVTSLDK